MKCPHCVAEGKTSRVYEGVVTTTLMGSSNYYDEEGKYHLHDPNWTTRTLSCSNGHHWQENTQNEC